MAAATPVPGNEPSTLTLVPGTLACIVRCTSHADCYPLVRIDDLSPPLGSIVDLFADDAILLVFVTVGVGAGLGAVRIKGIALGPAAALFVGLAIGAVDESLSGAAGLGVLRELGLVLFTYTVGLASGPTFVTGLRRGGASAVAVTAVLVIALGGICAPLPRSFDLTAADRAGLFAGSATNTPSLQAASEAVTTGRPGRRLLAGLPGGRGGDAADRHAATWPPPPFARQARTTAAGAGERIINWTVLVTIDSQPVLVDLRATYPGIAFSRVEHDGTVSVATAEQRVAPR